MDWRGQTLFCLALAVCLHVCLSDTTAERQTSSKSKSVVTRTAGSRCVSCVVNGQLFKGHSRFQYDDGCQRFRCICRCDGSYECPARYTQQICDDKEDTGGQGSDQSSSSSSSSSSSGSSSGSSSSRRPNRGRCTNCQVNGKEHPGHSYFTLEEKCLTIRNCICYCNGTWDCPKDRAERTCEDGQDTGSQTATGGNNGGETSNTNDNTETPNVDETGQTSSVTTTQAPQNNRRRPTGPRRRPRRCQNCTVDGKTFKGNAYFELVQGCAKFRYCACRCDGSWSCPDRFASSICDEEKEGTTTKRPSQPTTTDSDSDSRRRPGRGCSSCEVNGQTFQGNQYFQMKDDCIEYRNCACYCNGSWVCPDSGARNVCRDGDTGRENPPSRCRDCQVRNETFRGNSYFDTTDGCTEYKSCICRCDGSWNCSASRARNICQDEKGEDGQGSGSTVDRTSTCQSCEVQGETYPGNRYFSHTEGCIEYNSCICYCNGSWSCPASRARNRCDDGDGRNPGGETTPAPEACTECSVYGETFQGGTTFKINRGCIEYRNCKCDCDGAWRCPAESSVNTCQTGNSTAGGDGGDSTGCSQCHVYGKNFEGGNYFDVINGCISYRNCICRCDGSWQCSERYTENICDDEGGVTQDCSDCTAMGKTVQSNTRFELLDGCTEYTNCICRCNGSWECPSQFAKNICTEEERPTRRPETRCSECYAKGQVFPGNSNFDLTDGCNQYTNCHCNCDGSWDCFSENVRNICSEEENIRRGNCQECRAKDGRVHAPNTNFRMNLDCVEYSDCRCNCNGSWSCPGESAKWVCTDQCTNCLVEGRRIEGNTKFPLKTGCLEYTCDCFCNGSYVCPGSTVRNTCPVGVRNNCNRCTVKGEGNRPNRQYEGESDFTLRQDCIMYQCRCNCDGSWNCPGEDARNVCRGERLGGCRSCVVSDTEYYRGNTDFTLKKQCLQYECRCNCDGSWECPAEKTRNVCAGEVSGGCRNCIMEDGTVHKANSDFDLRQGCIHYKCKCKCNGGWMCPGKDARDVCKGEVPGGCRSCVLSENQYYPARSTFPLVQNCNNYLCTCNCNGSYNCIWQSRARSCRNDPRQPRGSPERTTNPPVASGNQQRCETCKVSATEEFAGRSRFTLNRECLRYSCDCNCDGSWKCPASRTERTCEERGCESCKVGLDEYPGRSTFFYTRRCHQFSCECQCGGRWTCDYRNPINICNQRQGVAVEREDRQDYSRTTARPTTESVSTERGSSNPQPGIRSNRPQNSRNRVHTVNIPSTNRYNCRKCYVDGRTIEPEEVFSLSRGCLQYRDCVCDCQGRWECAEEENVCDKPKASNTARRAESSRRGSGSEKKDVSTSAWVYAGGVNRSQIVTTDARTGGGYRQVQVDTRYLPTYTAIGRRQNQERGLDYLNAASASVATDTSSRHSETSSRHSENPGGLDRCKSCQADTSTYPPGATFDMRRGCVIYKCLCLCSGSYRCRLVPDNQCSTHERQNSCSNCLYNGMVFPGDMGFTVRDGCSERECNCSCDGQHTCSTPKPIPGCTPGTGVSASGPKYMYPVNAGLQPVRHSHVTDTGRQVYFSTCPTCNGGPGRRVVYHMPVHPASGSVGRDNRREERRTQSGEDLNPPGHGSSSCIQCLVDSVLRDGNSTFTFTKDCVEFDCYCRCNGAWKCAGRMSPQCSPGVGPDTGYVPGTVPHDNSCSRTCVVEGTEYPARSHFSLRKGCSEYKCTCNCDGGWVCPKQTPMNLCPPETPNARPRGRQIDPFHVRETELVADQAVSIVHGEMAEMRDGSHSSSKMTSVVKVNKIPTKCADCQVRGVVYPGNSTFFLREGCAQDTCQCNCDGNWECPKQQRIDVCKAIDEETKESEKRCTACVINGDVYPGGRDFQIESGCFQINCHCHCNGTHSCPRANVVNTCDPKILPAPKEIKKEHVRLPYGKNKQVKITPGNMDSTGNNNRQSGCKKCRVNEHTIKSLDTYIRQAGCFESVCHCDCSGEPRCPPGATVNVCKLKDTKPTSQRKGCHVGKRTHYTRVFARVKNCVQRTCICHDNGSWTCKQSRADRRVC